MMNPTALLTHRGLNASTESTAGAFNLEAGGFPGRSVALGVEVSLPFGRTFIAQEHAYVFSRYKREALYREQTIFAVIRGDVMAGARVRIGLVAGGGWVRGSSLDRVATFDSRSNAFRPFDAGEESTRYTIGVTGGADLIMTPARHLSVVPQFRMVVVRRGDLGDPIDAKRFFADLGLPTVMYRIGIGLRAAF